MEERRLLLAVALSLLVLTAYQLLFPPPPPPPAAPRRPPRRRAAAAAARRPAAPAAAAARRARGPRPRPRSPPVADERERRVEVEGPDASPGLHEPRRPPPVLAARRDFGTRRGRPEEMVPTVPGGPRPLDLETATPSWTRGCARRSSSPRRSAWSLAPGGGAELRLRVREGDLEAEKTLRVPRRRATWSR